MLAVLTVNNPTDSAVANELSLRQAVTQANVAAAAGTSDTIAFDASLGGQTLQLTQGQLELSGAGGGTITIDGSTPSSPITLDGGFSPTSPTIDVSACAPMRGRSIFPLQLVRVQAAGQFPAEPFEQDLLVGVGLGDAARADLATVSRGEHDVDHSQFT